MARNTHHDLLDHEELRLAANVPYDNTVSGLTAVDVQDAIDELVGAGSSTLDALTNVDTTGKADNDILYWDAGSSLWKVEAAPSGSGGGLLAVKLDNGSNKNSTSSTLADIDATNYVVTFTAPASGNVIVTLSGTIYCGTLTPQAFYSWGLRESTTTIGVTATVGASNNFEFYGHVSVDFYITGLTPGSSHTYKGAHLRSGSTTFSASITPRYIKVIEAP